MTSPHERRVAWQANHLAPSSALVPANPQTAAHRAAERRRGAEGTTSLLDAMSLWCPLAEEKRPFNRLLNDQVRRDRVSHWPATDHFVQLLAKTTKNQAIETLTTLLQLTENELPPHKASSPRSIRFRNLKFRRVVIEVSGALEYISTSSHTLATLTRCSRVWIPKGSERFRGASLVLWDALAGAATEAQGGPSRAIRDVGTYPERPGARGDSKHGGEGGGGREGEEDSARHRRGHQGEERGGV